MNDSETNRPDVGERFDWSVRSYECASDGKVTVANLCNYLQESAAINAEHLGFSKSNFEALGLNATWVMTRLRVKITRRPKWNETVSIFTFPRPARRIVAWRDFVISDAEGREIGRASSEWMMIDMTSRRPVAIPAFVSERANTVREPVFAEPLGFKLPAETFLMPATYTITAAQSDIDLNEHVNNVRYITWLYDARSDSDEGIDLEITFKSEVRVGQTVVVETIKDGTAILQRIRSESEHLIARRRGI